jgi:hypothetical protein
MEKMQAIKNQTKQLTYPVEVLTPKSVDPPRFFSGTIDEIGVPLPVPLPLSAPVTISVASFSWENIDVSACVNFANALDFTDATVEGSGFIPFNIDSDMFSATPMTPSPIPASTRQRQLLSREGGYFSGSNAANRLAIGMPELDQMREHGEVIGILTSDGFVYPAWQFSNGGLLAGLSELLVEMDFDPWMKLSFMLSPNDALSGESPLSALRQGQDVSVQRAARVFGEQGSI